MVTRVNKILVPVDSSEGAGEAASFAAYLAECTGASLSLLHVFDIDPAIAMGAVSLSAEQLQKAREARSKRAFEAVGKVIDLDKLQPRMDIRHGKVSMEIINYAKAEGIDLIVMGCRGLSGIQEFLLGSVSSQVLHHAPCSVTVVR